METSLRNANLEIEKILNYISLTNKEKTILEDITQKSNNSSDKVIELLELKNSSSNRLMYRINHYTFIIITLYGILENYLENFIEEYINLLKELNKSNKLSIDEKIEATHTKTCIKFLDSFPKKYEDILTKENIIQSLYYVQKGYYEKLNSKIFTYHEANFRKKTINDFFGKVCITKIVDEIEKDKTFKLKCQEYSSLDITYILDDLAERRNVLSHGGVIDDILNLNMLKEYTQLIKTFINSFNHLVNRKLFENKIIYEINSKNYNRLKIIKIINNKILCFELEKNCICRNKSIIIIEKEKDSKKTYAFSEVKQIQVNNKSLDYVPFSYRIENVGLELSHTLKDNYFYYLYTP